MIVALIGAAIVLSAVASRVIQLWVSVRRRQEYAVPAGDPWDGRSLEWASPAPPPEYNFFVLPQMTARDAFTYAKETGTADRAPAEFDDIEMPKNSTMGMIICVVGTFIAFGLVCHIWWLVVVGLLGTIATVIGRGFARDAKRIIPARAVQQAQQRWLDVSRQPVRSSEIRKSKRPMQGLRPTLPWAPPNERRVAQAS